VIPRAAEDEFVFLGCDGVFDVLKNQTVADLISNKLLELESLAEVALQVTRLACVAQDLRWSPPFAHPTLKLWRRECANIGYLRR